MANNTKKKLPIGIESFEEIRTEDFYYTDKTGLIRNLLRNWGEVNQFTRPRRFGKSLNMSMLKAFFELGCDRSLFEGLDVMQDPGLCDAWMGKYPVISISLKSVNGNNYDTACSMMSSIIGREALRFQFLLESDRLTDVEKSLYSQLIMVGENNSFNIPDTILMGSLYTLSALLKKHYGLDVIILIDEYDVPLAKANENGYYDQMVMLIRNMFDQALKTNGNLKFAVLTGCLRIAKESIFTGLNNMKVLSVTDVRFDEYFGFMDAEVQEMLKYYGLSDHYDTIKEWYDGYRFGKTEVYCPWDVLCYCDALLGDRSASPEAYWSNTSGNEAIRHFLEQAGSVTRRELEQLIAGGTVSQRPRCKHTGHQISSDASIGVLDPRGSRQMDMPDLTYNDMYDSIDNVWSLLFTTGYLTQRGVTEQREYILAIPNKEIRNIFTEQILQWFQDTARKDGDALHTFCNAFKNGDNKTAEKKFNEYLRRTISIRDTAVRRDKKENYYHGILLGLLSFESSWDLASNRESGDGYCDIMAEIDTEGIGIVIELKYADNGDLDAACRKAMEQIDLKRYDEQLIDDGMETILKYGVACYKKRCRIILDKTIL